MIGRGAIHVKQRGVCCPRSTTRDASESSPGSFLRATAAMARGRLCLAATTGDPCGCLREALSGFTKARTPTELAQAHFELAKALASDQPEGALAEARAARNGFERLPAARQADAAGALMRSLGSQERPTQRTTGVLTKRETEVLVLIPAILRRSWHRRH